jgi:DNA-binding SARP family transcriptional activator/tetratricopeptide (TPR) repeat protein
MQNTATDVPTEFLVLGPVEVVSGGAPVRLATGRAQTVLVMLLLEAGRVVPLQRLVAALWEDDPPDTARSQVQICVSALRRMLAGTGAAILTQPPGYLLRIPDGSLDLWRFRKLCGTAESLAGRRPAESAARYREALALWRGDACASVASRVVAQAAIPLNEERWTALQSRMALELGLGRHHQVVAELAQLVAAEPLRERLRALLMLALYRSGRQADALEAYRSGRRLLAEEIGIDPGKELRALELAILAGDPALDVRSQASPGAPSDALAALPLLRQPSTSVPDLTGPDDSINPVPDLRQRQAEFLVTAVPVPVPGKQSAASDGMDSLAARKDGGGSSGVLTEELDTESDIEPHRQLLAAGPAPEAPAARGKGGSVVPRQLPGTVPSFTGRATELAALTQVLEETGTQAAGTVVISAIGGTAGVGKTALAVHWAHQVALRFPGGQLYVNLRGFDPSGTPVRAAEAIRGFLDALGVPTDRIPHDLAAQAGLYRSLLADRKMLIVLDNARDEEQIRPLLPGTRGCLVVVTSRNQLTGLAATTDARLLALGVFPDADGRAMLTARLGARRAAAEPEAVAEITELCAGLPLALAITAARAAARPGLPLAVLAAELRDTAGRLDALDAGDQAASVRAVFSWSVRQLSPAAARMFRLLGLHPGPDISAPAAASLAAVTPAQARQDLGELSRASLITEHRPGRYACHDLLRAYAASQASAIDSDADRHAAVGRVLDHYLHSAHTAALLISSNRYPITVSPPRPGVGPERLADHQQALAWMQAEHQVLLAAITLADSTGSDVHAWQIPWTMLDFLQRRGHWHQQAAIQRTAVAAATRLGDPAGQAASLRLLALACVSLGDYGQARAHCAASLRLSQQLGDRAGEAKAHQQLAVAADGQGRHADVLDHAAQALRLYRATGDRPGEACMLNNAGWAHAMLGDFQKARACCQQALTLAAELGLPHVECHAWDSLGYAEYHLGNLAEATACYQRALEMFREAGDLAEQADTLTRLGDTRHASGELRQARDAWQQALDILNGLKHPDAGRARARLQELNAGRPPR